MQPDKFLIAIVVFGLFTITSFLIVIDLNTNYDLAIGTDNFAEAYNTTQEINSLVQDQKEEVVGEGSTVDTDDTESSLFSGAHSAVRLMKNSFGIVGDVLNALADLFKIPAFFIGAALTVLTILTIFSLIYLIFRFKPT